MDLANLVVSVDSRDASRAASDLDKLTKAAERTEASTESLSKASTENAQRYRDIGRAALDRKAALDQEVRSSVNATQATRRVTVEMRAQAQQYTQLASAELAAQRAAERHSRSLAQQARAAEENRKSLQRLLSQIDPLEGKLNKLDDLEAKLNQTFRQGAVDVDGYGQALAKINAQRTDVVDRQIRTVASGAGEAAKSIKLMGLNSAESQRSLITLGRAAASGNWAYASTSMGTLARTTGLLSVAFSGIGLAITGVVGFLGLLGLAYHKGSQEASAYNVALIETGHAAGVTSAQLAGMANRIGEQSGSISTASRALTELVRSGRVAGRDLEVAGGAIANMAQVTGRSVADMASEFDALARDPLKAIEDLHEKYGYLTVATRSQVQALVEQGREQDAVTLVVREHANMMEERAPQIAENIGHIARAWRAAKAEAQGYIDAAMNIGRERSPEEIQADITSYDARIASVQANHGGVGLVGRFLGADQDKALTDLRARRDVYVRELEQTADAIQAAEDKMRYQSVQSAGIEAAKFLENAAVRADKAAQKAAEIAKVQRASTTAIMAAASDVAIGERERADLVAKLEKQEQDALVAINKRYAPKGGAGDSLVATLRARLAEEKSLSQQLAEQGTQVSRLNEFERQALQIGEQLAGSLTKQQRSRLQEAKALATETGALRRANDERQKELKEREKHLSGIEKSIADTRKEAETLRDKAQTMGMSRVELERLTDARLEDRIVALEGQEGMEDEIALLQQLQEERRGLTGAILEHEAAQAEQATWTKWARDVEQIFNRVGQSLTDAIFEGGKSGRDLLKDVFKGLTFNVLINPVMGAMQGAVTQSLGGMFGYQNPGQQQGGQSGGMPSFNTMMGTGFGNSLVDAGSFIGSSMVSQFGAGLTAGAGGALTDAGASALMGIGVEGSSSFASGSAVGGAGVGSIMGYGKAIYDLTQGNYGEAIGTAIGTYILPGIGTVAGGFVGGLVDSIFGSSKPTTRRGKRTTAVYEDGEYDITDRDSRIGREAADVVKAMTEAGVTAANDLLSQVGADAAIDSFYSLMSSSIYRDRDGVASGGAIRVGDELIDFGIARASDDTKYGVGGWSDAEMLPRLQADIQLSMLEAFQAVGDQLPSVLADMLDGADIRGMELDAALALAEQFGAVINVTSAFLQLAETMPFDHLRDLSFDAAANLIAFAGGIEALDAGLTSYFQNFYSESEQLEFAAKQMGGAFESLGIEMPDVTQGAEQAKAAYRGIVESLDLTTESGQQSYAMLMTLNSGFAELVAGMDELNDVASTAAEIASERYDLETQLLQLQGDTAELRRRELAGLDESNHALQERIWALQEEQQATQEAAQVAAQIASQQTALMNQLAQAIGDTSVMRRAELDALDESNQALQLLIWAYQDAVAATNAAYSAVQRLGQEEIKRLQQTATATDAAMSALENASKSIASNLKGVFDLLQTSVRDLRGEVEATSRMEYMQARAAISTALVTGQVSDTDAMQLAIRAANEGVASGVYSSKFEQDRAYLVLAAEMEQLQGITGTQLTAAEETLELARKQFNTLRGIDDSINTMSVEQAARALGIAMVAEEQANQQIAIIEEQLNWAEQQYNALRGLGDEFSTFAGAIDGLASAIKTERAASNAVNNAINQPGLSREQQYLINNPDVMGEYGIHGGGLSLDEYARDHWDRYGQYEVGLPGRTSFAVGTPFVPHDMTADIHRGEIIIDPRSSDVLRRYGISVQGGGGNDRAVQDEIKALRADLKAGLFQIAKNTGKSVKRQEDQERLDREIGHDIVSAIEAIA